MNLYPDNVCIGETFIGSVYSNMPNASCTTYISQDEINWIQYLNYSLDAFGSYSEIRSIDMNGTATLYVKCIYDGKEVTSSKERITVEDCYYCHDSDVGQNKGSLGMCEDSYNKMGFQDVCLDSFSVKEYYCNDSGICNNIRMICNANETCISGKCTVI